MEVEKRLLDEFKMELMSTFIDLCWGNDYNELTLLSIGETIDSVYEKYSLIPTGGAVEVVHAQWLDIQFDPMWRSMLATCLHCKVRGEVRVKSNECGFAVPDSDHCPACGAKMDGGTV